MFSYDGMMVKWENLKLGGNILKVVFFYFLFGLSNKKKFEVAKYSSELPPMD